MWMLYCAATETVMIVSLTGKKTAWEGAPAVSFIVVLQGRLAAIYASHVSTYVQVSEATVSFSKRLLTCDVLKKKKKKKPWRSF